MDLPESPTDGPATQSRWLGPSTLREDEEGEVGEWAPDCDSGSWERWLEASRWCKV